MRSQMAGRILVTALLLSPLAARAESDDEFPLLEATVSELQTEMARGQLTSEQLTRAYIERIHKLDSSREGVNAVIELNPDALALARQADAMRRAGQVLGPLHGIPVLLKANIDTADRMQTTAGSFALQGTPAQRDSTVAANLRAGGAVILGKTNLSEWANFRSFESISGWSGIGGQTHNPYGIDRNPCGSSSGSGAAASANFAAVSLGTETDGSVVCPGNANGVVGLKPTVGLTSRAGVVPISHTQDTVGIHARTVADAAATLGVIQSGTPDGRDPATGGVPLGWQGTGKTRPTLPTDYTQFVHANGLAGARLGITRAGLSGFGPPGFPNFVATPQTVLNAFETAVSALTAAGATVFDLDAAGFIFPSPDGENLVLFYDFKFDVASYFQTRVGVPVAGGTLQSAIDFNNAHAAIEMPYFNQDIFDFSQTMNPDPDFCDTRFTSAQLLTTAKCMTYKDALEIGHRVGANGIDAAIAQFNLDAVVSATDNPAWATDLIYGDHFLFGTSSLAASPGYPIVQVPAAMVFGVPLGMSFFGSAFSEPTLIKLASGFEAATQTRAHNLPTFAATVPFDHIKGPLQQGNSSGSGANSAAGTAAVSQAAAVAAAATPSQAATANVSAKANKTPHHL